MRKTLIELLHDELEGCPRVENVADHLIANGVTVQEWIPVTERLPEADGYYLCCVRSCLFPDSTYLNILACDKYGFQEGSIYTDNVTHWMHLPEAPKEGTE